MHPLRYLRKKYWDWQIKRGVMVLKSLDNMIKKAGYKRQERRRFWRDFFNRQELRDHVLERLNGKKT